MLIQGVHGVQESARLNYIFYSMCSDHVMWLACNREKLNPPSNTCWRMSPWRHSRPATSKEFLVIKAVDLWHSCYSFNSMGTFPITTDVITSCWFVVCLLVCLSVRNMAERHNNRLWWNSQMLQWYRKQLLLELECSGSPPGCRFFQTFRWSMFLFATLPRAY